MYLTYWAHSKWQKPRMFTLCRFMSASYSVRDEIQSILRFTCQVCLDFSCLLSVMSNLGKDTHCKYHSTLVFNVLVTNSLSKLQNFLYCKAVSNICGKRFFKANTYIWHFICLLLLREIGKIDIDGSISNWFSIKPN